MTPHGGSVDSSHIVHPQQPSPTCSPSHSNSPQQPSPTCSPSHSNSPQQPSPTCSPSHSNSLQQARSPSLFHSPTPPPLPPRMQDSMPASHYSSSLPMTARRISPTNLFSGNEQLQGMKRLLIFNDQGVYAFSCCPNRFTTASTNKKN